jgi:hypothetical protein
MRSRDWKKPRKCGWKECDETFIPKRRGQEWHSKACRYAAWNDKRQVVRLSEKGVQRRSLRTDIRNPLLRLSCAKQFALLEPSSQKILRTLLSQLAADAKNKAQKSWSANKAPMAAYWKAVSVYAGHAKRLLSEK